jgi:NAD(P)H-dependent FMN reductase
VAVVVMRAISTSTARPSELIRWYWKPIVATTSSVTPRQFIGAPARHPQWAGKPPGTIKDVLIEVISSTTREGRFSERTAHWVDQQLRARDTFDVELIDLRDHPLPFFDAVPPAKAGRDYANDEVARLGRTLDRADGFIVLTAEYNHGYPAVLKNAMDWTFPEWQHKPIAFVGWGNVGGARAIEQLRLVAVEFEMAPLRHAVHILPDVMMAARQAGDVSDTSAFTPLEPKLKLLADDLSWWAAALAAARARDQR